MNMMFPMILAIGAICLGAVFIYVILRKNERLLPRDGVQWLAVSMSVLLMLTSGILLALVLASGRKGELAQEGLNVPVTDFAFRLVGSGEEHRIADYGGSVVLLNFWATWCQPCIVELPELDSLQATYRSEGLVVVTISDEQRDHLLLYQDLLPQETVSGFFDGENLPEPFYTELAKGRPISYVIDREGYLRHYVIGAGDYASFESLVEPFLERTMAAR